MKVTYPRAELNLLAGIDIYIEGYQVAPSTAIGRAFRHICLCPMYHNIWWTSLCEYFFEASANSRSWVFLWTTKKKNVTVWFWCRTAWMYPLQWLSDLYLPKLFCCDGWLKCMHHSDLFPPGTRLKALWIDFLVHGSSRLLLSPKSMTVLLEFRARPFEWASCIVVYISRMVILHRSKSLVYRQRSSF